MAKKSLKEFLEFPAPPEEELKEFVDLKGGGLSMRVGSFCPGSSILVGSTFAGSFAGDGLVGSGL
ncbi:MAG: hypothetical protein IPK08_21145 [Bacteroidetes bacterium]|nr:hypothetical protein [Bacteroidota bacterium]